MAEGCGGKGLPVVLGSVGMFRVLQVSSRMRPLFVPARAVKRCGWEQGGGDLFSQAPCHQELLSCHEMGGNISL